MKNLSYLHATISGKLNIKYSSIFMSQNESPRRKILRISFLQKKKKREGEKREKNKNALQSNRTLSLSLFHHKFHLKFRLKSTSYIKFTLKFSVYIKLSSVITVEPPRQQFPRRFSRNFKTRTRRNVSLVKFFTRLRRFSPRTGHLLRR